jgi:branched-chain amino acid transport system permease protein
VLQAAGMATGGTLAVLEGWLPYLTPGFVNGAVWALVAVGLVLTYQTTGVLNLAFGAQAFAAGIIYYDLIDRGGWPPIAAVIASAFVASPIIGYGLDRLVYRHMRTQPIVIRLAVTIGMLTAIPSIMLILLGFDDERLAPPPILFKPVRYYRWGSVAFDSNQLLVVIVSAVVLVSLGLFMRYSDMGLRMRAVVESPRLAEIHGVGSIGVSTVAWIVSSVLAGLAGVLLVPSFNNLTPVPYTLLVMAGLSAAVFAKLRSLPLAVVGAIIAGVGADLILKLFDGTSTWEREISAGLRPSFPFVLMIVVLLSNRSLGESTRVSDPMAGVDPPPMVAGALSREIRTVRQRAIRWGGVGLGFLVCWWWFGPNTLASAGFMAVIFLSLMLLVGQGGHVSLGHAAFVGIGALVSAQLVDKADWPFLLAVLVGALAAAAGGFLLAIPSLRLGELPLALATFGFGIMCTFMLFQREFAFGIGANIFLARPELGPFDLGDDDNFMLLSFAVLACTMLLMRHLLKGTTGKFAVALRGSPTAAASIGINAVPLRIAIFSLSAGLAGLAGGFLGFLNQGINPNSYTANTSLYWVVVAMVVGVFTMRSAVAAGLILVLLPKLIDRLPDSLALFEFVLFGLGVVLLSRQPLGAFEYFANLPSRMRERSSLLSGTATAEDHARALDSALDEPEVQPDEPGLPVEVLVTTPQERVARRAKLRELRIDLARLRIRMPAYPITFLYLMTFAFAVDAMSRSLLGIVLEDVRRDFGVGDFDMSVLNAVYLTVAGISVIPFGIIADRWNRRNLIALGFLPWALAMMWQSVAGTFAMILIARAFLGSIEGTNGPATPSLLGDYYPVKRRNRAFGIFATGTSLGTTLGILIGGALAASIGWRGAFFTFGVIGAVVGLVLWRVLDEPERGLQDTAFRLESEIDQLERVEQLEAEAMANPEMAETILAPLVGNADDDSLTDAIDAVGVSRPPDGGPPITDDYRSVAPKRAMQLLLRNRTFTLLLVGQIVTDFFIGILGFFAITFFRRYHGLSVAGASGVVSLLSIALIIGTVQAGRIGDRLVARGTPGARVKLTWVNRLLVFGAISVAWATPNLALAIPGFLLTGYLLGLTNPLTAAMSVDLVVARLRGVSAGMVGAIRAGATALGPVVLGFLSDRYGMRQGTLFVAPTLLISCAITWLAGRFYDRDHEFAQRESVRQHVLEQADERASADAPAEAGLASG